MNNIDWITCCYYCDPGRIDEIIMNGKTYYLHIIRIFIKKRKKRITYDRLSPMKKIQ